MALQTEQAALHGVMAAKVSTARSVIASLRVDDYQPARPPASSLAMAPQTPAVGSEQPGLDDRLSRAPCDQTDG